MLNMQIRYTRISLPAVAAIALAAFAGACQRRPEMGAVAVSRQAGTAYTVKDTTIAATFDAAGVAEPVQQAVLSTKLMGTVTEVLVKEGDRVAAGQPLVRIDARDLAAKQSQVSASIAEAEAMQHDANTQAGRIRALYADSAATRAQLDAVETAQARADAGLRAARSAAAELDAISTYSVIRAPFAGVITRRFVDPGAFAAPGAPLVAVQDDSRLRIAASAAPEQAGRLARGSAVDASIENVRVNATVEGIVPAASGNLYTINAVVANPARRFLAGSTATLMIPDRERSAILVPASAVIREGDLTAVVLRSAGGDERRWVRLGRDLGGVVEVSAGLRPGDVIVLPPASPAAVAEGN